ncbi:hypothetical protein KSF_085240 [Reticulibacter mediterranei]|uniref:Uncharacterized protein n=1 Tax=Reticulibacter mediterranei TaxID=2778369 RepID=A0A8J3IYP1_9CHLR|nr:hypothetical protein KSF_085240 [Reticulibacter mediterranei]
MVYFGRVWTFDQETRKPIAMAPIISPEQRQNPTLITLVRQECIGIVQLESYSTLG